MILTGKEDMRVQRTIRAIQNAFEQLLYEKDYDRITVKELCAAAGINKKTFYTYYETLDHLLMEYKQIYYEEYRDSFLASFHEYQYPRDIKPSIAHFFRYAAQQNKTYEKILPAAVSHSTIGGHIVSNVMGSIWEDSAFAQSFPPFYRQIISDFWTRSVLGIYNAWLDSGKNIPLEYIIQTAQALVPAGIEALDQNRPPNCTVSSAIYSKDQTQTAL